MKKGQIILIIIIASLMLLSFGLILIYNNSHEEVQAAPEVEVPKDDNNQEEPDNDDEPIIEEGLTLTELKDHNRHYSLGKIMNNYMAHVKNSNPEVYNIVLDEFENSISNIVLDKTYTIDQVQFIKVNDRVTKYNVKGYLQTIEMDAIEKLIPFDTTIFLDTVNMTYQIALEYDYNKDLTAIEEVGNNTYSVQSMNDNYIASLYFSDLRGKIMRNDPNIKSIITNYDNVDDIYEIFNQSISTFKINEKKDILELTITDKQDTKYVFEIKSVLNYTVKIY